MVTTHVLVHGFAGGPWSWESVMAELRAPAVALTLPQHQVPTSFSDMAAWLREEVEDLGVPLSGIHLAGYSAGGRLVAGALAEGLAVRSASLISSGLGGLSPAERDERARTDAAWSALLRRRGTDAFLDAWEAQPIFATQRGLPAAAIQRAHRTTLDPHALADLMDALSVSRMPDLRNSMRALRLPWQVVVGALDAKYVAQVRDIGPPAVVELAQCGHNPLLEAPAALAAALDEFVLAAGLPSSH